MDEGDRERLETLLEAVSFACKPTEVRAEVAELKQLAEQARAVERAGVEAKLSRLKGLMAVAVSAELAAVQQPRDVDLGQDGDGELVALTWRVQITPPMIEAGAGRVRAKSAGVLLRGGKWLPTGRTWPAQSVRRKQKAAGPTGGARGRRGWPNDQ
jgi:hypothetical protein